MSITGLELPSCPFHLPWCPSIFCFIDGIPFALPVEGRKVSRLDWMERWQGSHDWAHRQQGSHTRAHLAAGSHDVIPFAQAILYHDIALMFGTFRISTRTLVASLVPCIYMHSSCLDHLHVLRQGALIRNKVQHTSVPVLQLLCDFAYRLCAKVLKVRAPSFILVIYMCLAFNRHYNSYAVTVYSLIGLLIFSSGSRGGGGVRTPHFWATM